MAPHADLHDFAAIRAVLNGLPDTNAKAAAAARDRQGRLTKPPGSLGRLEDLAVWYAGWRGDPRPRIERPQVVVFAANHGVAARGVSAFPAAVTAQMVANFRAGGAAINQLAAAAGARLDVVALDPDRPTGDIAQGPAMTETEAAAAFAAGWDAVAEDADLFVAGEMGIGNTTVAAAIGQALLGGDLVGRGTGVDADGLARKREAVAAALAANPARDGLGVMAGLGGREVAAMTGAMARARALRVPVLLDGFVATAALLCLWAEEPRLADHCVAAHRSAEAGHGRMLDALGLAPILDLGLRLGEGSGAALAIPVLRAAVACHSGMATFAEAGVG